MALTLKCSCSVGPARPDRPHLLLHQQRGTCGCGARVEDRVVLRGGEAWRLRTCPACGNRQERVDPDGAGYLERFVAAGRAREGVFKQTTAACPTCLDLVDADVAVRGGKVYFEKRCSACGPSRALVCEDAAWYVEAYRAARAGTSPFVRATAVAKGCPQDCGLCPDHEQHTCIPIVEVTDWCNLSCPACLVDNANAHHLAPEAFRRIVDGLLAAEGSLETLALSGGEPTSHPRILELLDVADRPEIGRVVLLTNGLRIASDRRFAEELKRRGTYVGLQYDGASARPYELLRGRDLREEKQRALAVLEELQLPSQLLFTAARGVNEDQIGDAVRLFLAQPHLVSLNFQPLALTGRGGAAFGGDPLDRITVPGVLKAIERQTGGMLKQTDFVPLPCPSPHCVALTFLLRLDDGRFVPLARFADFKRHGQLLRNSASLPALPEIEAALKDVTYHLFAHADRVPDGEAILAAMNRAIRAMFPERTLSFREALRIGESQVKSIFVHHYMDPHDFDLERLRKCCNHYPQADGRLMPVCGFNLFHRGAARGAGTPRASWGRAPWGGEG